MVLCFSFFITAGAWKAASQLRLPQNGNAVPLSKPITVLPQNFYNQHIGFFCKKESQLQQHTNLNLFVRLGNKDYVDYLERKPNAKVN